MSQRQLVRYHEHMKPRFSTTFESSNTANAISMAQWHQDNALKRNQSEDSKGNFFRMNSYFQNGAFFQTKKQNNVDSLKNNIPQETSYNNNSGQQHFPNKPTSREARDPFIRNNSRLSNLGSSSLKKFPEINERDVYEKQQSKYNIITILPKEHLQTIKKYPKYHLQNLDTNYEKKKHFEQEYAEYWKKSGAMNNSSIGQDTYYMKNRSFNPESGYQTNTSQLSEVKGPETEK